MKNMFRSGSPVFGEKTFQQQFDTAGTSPMTLDGTIQKAALLLLITLLTSFVGWMFPYPILIIGSALVGFGLALFISFKPNLSPILAPLYAVLEGIFVGGLSYFVNEIVKQNKWDYAIGVVPVAILGTLLVFGIMLGLYASRIIKVTETFRMVVVGATIAIAVLYLGVMAVSFFWPGVYAAMPIFGSGPIGIGFSVLVIGLAAFNLALDFDIIERGVQGRAPKFMEWYAGFALLVTLVWLYVEILRLLMKLSNRR